MKKILVTSLLVTILLFSCKENSPLNPQDNLVSNESKQVESHYGKITDDDINNLHDKVSTFSSMLLKMYSDDKVVNEVNSFIKIGFYSDENIVLKDLLLPEVSPWFRTARISGYGKFKEAFSKEYNIKLQNNPRLRMSGEDFSNYLVDNGVSIYFPYSERHFDKKYEEITIVMPPKEDINATEGVRLKKCGNQICEEKVWVDDTYAMNHPTHIIYAGGADVKKKYENKLKNARVKSISSVYVGAARCNKQYDALISFTGNGGGSEIKFFRGSGYLSYDTNNQITNITGDIISVDFSRSSINGCNTQVINAIWDLDWKSDNFEQVFGIYEEDTKGEISFTGTVSTTIKQGNNNITGSLSYTIKRQSQDEIIRNWKINRNAFYTANPNSQGYGAFGQVGGLVGGPWAAWDGAIGVGDCSGANIAFVLPTVTQ